MEFKQIYKSFTKRTSLFVFSIRKEDRGKEFIWTCVSCIWGRSEGVMDNQFSAQFKCTTRCLHSLSLNDTKTQKRKDNKGEVSWPQLETGVETMRLNYRILFTSISNFTNICSEIYVWSMQIKICTMATKHWEKEQWKYDWRKNNLLIHSQAYSTEQNRRLITFL